MEAGAVTNVWMAGVIGVMVAYAAIALLGMIKQRGRNR